MSMNSSQERPLGRPEGDWIMICKPSIGFLGVGTWTGKPAHALYQTKMQQPPRYVVTSS